jgi:uncharacterized protein
VIQTALAPLLLFAGALLLSAPPAQAVELVPVPHLTARVVDQAGVLPADVRERLEADLAAFEAQKGSQIAVLVVPTTQPEAIEQYALRVSEAWKLGREKEDDGVLFLVAVQDRAMRIEVGYGLEGVLPDAVANRILDEVVTPRFREGDYPGGIQAGVQAMTSVLSGSDLPPPAAAKKRGKPGAAIQLLFIAALAAIFILPALFGRLFGGLTSGVVVGVLSWLLLGSLFIGIVFGALALVFGLIGLGSALGSGLGGIGGGGRGWSSHGGGFGGGGFGGGGGGFGGFGGGGGGFGGGGASGNW